MNRNYFCLLICMVFLIFHVYPQVTDSTGSSKDTVFTRKKFISDCFFATSFFINSNWKEKNNSNILFFGSVNISYIKNIRNIKTIRELRSELGYQKIPDSSWFKTADKFFLSSIWILNNHKGFKHSFSVNLKTQFTNTWENSLLQNDSKRIWISGPLLPLICTIGYGTNIAFKESSYLNFSIASLKIKSVPRSENIAEIKTIAKTEKFLLISEYGFNIQWLFKNKFSDSFIWENKFSLFTKTLDKKGTTLDMQNILAFIPFSHIKINLINKIVYDFLISEKIQYRYELLVGYSFGKN